MNSPESDSRRELAYSAIAYYCVLTALFVASFFPHYRVWGLNGWAYFPLWVRSGLLGIGAVIPVIMWIVTRKMRLRAGTEDTDRESSGRYLAMSIALTVLFGLAFYFLRARTHFLGDGYMTLSVLAVDNPLIKPRELGESLVHIWVKWLVGGTGESAALLSFQIVSIASGMLLVSFVAYAAWRLFERNVDRIVFLLGIATGGYMLLFFGYVENYSLFVLSIAIYALVGLLVADDRINLWLLLPPAGCAIFFHVFGVLLLPSALYLLIVKSKHGRVFRRLHVGNRVLFGAALAVVVVLVYMYFYTTDYFFRFAFLPVLKDRFTVGGYTLFSMSHLVDYCNLLLLLLPGAPLLAARLYSSTAGKLFEHKPYRFLLALLAPTLAAAFVFDPKIGMPRDWDLFSFAGVPLSVFFYYHLHRRTDNLRNGLMSSVLAVSLSLLVLVPRAVSQTISATSIAQFEDYCSLDKSKNKAAGQILVDYYKRIGNRDQADAEMERWLSSYPENRLVDSAMQLILAGRPQEAIPLLNHVIEVNPRYADAWANLGMAFVAMKRYDEAIEFCDIANGLNPYNAAFLCGLGQAHALAGNLEPAERLYKKSLALSGDSYVPVFELIKVYASRRQRQLCDEYLTKLSQRSDVPDRVFRDIANWFAVRGDSARAAEVGRIAQRHAQDSSRADSAMGTRDK
ncbi:MAG TPA: tetratricopeptide repeat protein [Candidatus Deferrimicrobium sp.]|nr:tetratricopeptide repeat protein [Candidatus Deferrimicrobium sp.]